MCVKSEEHKEPLEIAIQHYEFISKEFTDYFKMYMQSWSIVGSVLFVGIIFALKNDELIKTDIQLYGILLSITPILLLLWFLPTCWFWGYFIMYRKYLHWLEERIADLDGNYEDIVCFHTYRQKWFTGPVQTIPSGIAGLLIILIYGVLAYAVSEHVGKLTIICWTFDNRMIFLIYAMVGVVSMIVAVILLTKTPDPESVCKSNNATNNRGTNNKKSGN